MTTHELQNRLKLIQDSLNTRRQEALLLSQNLEQINKSISQLEGNFHECNFWLQSISQEKAELPNEQASNESAQEAA